MSLELVSSTSPVMLPARASETLSSRSSAVAVRAATVRGRMATLKEIGQGKVIVVVEAHPLTNVTRADLGGLQTDEHVGRDAEIRITAEQEVLADGAFVEAAVGVDKGDRKSTRLNS